ncbi:MAG: NAD(P)-binding domain-containing protein [Rhodococcus sp. (in: high G+C Gram-positive bacteria)]|jgi:3-hydroxyisobutyrate dehydrogenase-like beta-hydroxyacid dehydrogenase|uniref:NAD(P)-dependent oxidoreductase n=1 Tax=Rhodococcus sp. EPR-157 TaxID=1813677 RepID=UPI0007BC19A2|nr:NAD(P)-binding domain-containing protein [Rhodococcus sp. EPR-157]KZF08062.1 6-phosphogluconate dehydrogenase [Rhodococcus sp. EPR-157]
MSVSVLGAGDMGRALAEALLAAEYRVTVWNRTRSRADPLGQQGATVVESATDATRSDLVVICLLDYASVLEVLDPLAETLTGKSLVNVTTTSPNQSRLLSDWADGHGIRYLDGGILAVPEMIGNRGSAVFYSGNRSVFDEHRETFEVWGSATFYGGDAGMAALYDFALLSAMYIMFAGFMHGAALLGSVGVPAAEFASLATAWLSSLTASFAEFADIIDRSDYSGPGQQSLDFSDLTEMVDASSDQGIAPDAIAMVQKLIHRQQVEGRGADSFARIYESIADGGEHV